MKELTTLIQRINKTNCSVQFDETRTLADALVERDQKWDKRLTLAKIAEEGSIRNDRYSRSEIKIISTVDVAAIQKAGRPIIERVQGARHEDSRLKLEY